MIQYLAENFFVTTLVTLTALTVGAALGAGAYILRAARSAGGR